MAENISSGPGFFSCRKFFLCEIFLQEIFPAGKFFCRKFLARTFSCRKFFFKEIFPAGNFSDQIHFLAGKICKISCDLFLQAELNLFSQEKFPATRKNCLVTFDPFVTVSPSFSDSAYEVSVQLAISKLH